MTKQCVQFLGLAFEPMEANAAAGRIAAAASVDLPFWYVVTPNVDHRIRLEREPDLRPLYSSAGLVLNDSRILEFLARRDGIALQASPGADIVAHLFVHAIRQDETVTMVGGDAELAAALSGKFGLTDFRWHDAPQGLRSDPEAIERAAAFIAENPARFHFLCVGSPQQEMVALAALRRGGAVGVGLCCGVSLEFLAGRIARAPLWMRRARLEWLHRLLSEPRRLARRYLVDGPAILRIWIRDRRVAAPFRRG